MATGTILLPLLGSQFDATNPPGVDYTNSCRKYLFDDTTPELVYWEFRMPVNYASSPVIKVQYTMASAVVNSVQWEAYVMAVTDGDAQDLDAESYDAKNSGNGTVPGTAGYLDEISFALSNADGVAAGDYVRIKFARDADDGNDDATGDAELRNVALEYTTT